MKQKAHCNLVIAQVFFPSQTNSFRDCLGEIYFQFTSLLWKNCGTRKEGVTFLLLRYLVKFKWIVQITNRITDQLITDISFRYLQSHYGTLDIIYSYIEIQPGI